MTAQEQTPRIGPLLFPLPTVKAFDDGEIVGLPKDTAPQNCEILLSGVNNSRHLGRQTHYLVRFESSLILLRVCTAMEGSGYDEYAVIRSIASTDIEKELLEVKAHDSIEVICGQVADHQAMQS
jgi:hypothetical protein